MIVAIAQIFAAGAMSIAGFTSESAVASCLWGLAAGVNIGSAAFQIGLRLGGRS